MSVNNQIKDWTYTKLRDLVTINYGKSPKEILSSYGNYPVVGTGGTERYGNGFLHDGDSTAIPGQTIVTPSKGLFKQVQPIL